MRTWVKAGGKEVVPNTFASQYISIILIIFTCIVWAFFSDQTRFVRPEKQESAPSQKPVQQRKVSLSSEISTVSLETLFTSGGVLNAEEAEPFALFLSNHDVNAEFEVMVPVNSAENSFSMGRDLEAFFRSKAIPAGAAKVFILTGQDKAGVRIRLTKGGAP